MAALFHLFVCTTEHLSDGLLQREKVITIIIVIGLFGGLIGGPVASLADYYASPQKRLWLFLIPEFIGFACMGLMIVYGRSKKTQNASKSDVDSSL